MLPEISIKAETVFHIGNWPITNALLLSFATFLVLIAIALLARRKLSLVPGKLQSILELFTEQVFLLMDGVLGSRRQTLKYFPLIATIFLFIMTSNWLGLLPGIGPVSVKEFHEGKEIAIPLFRSPASDLNFTIALAMISVASVNFLGVVALGFKRHAGKFFTFKSPIFTFAGILEFIAEFVKIISFSFRLFGNVFAGEVLLTIIAFLGPYFLPLPFLFLEVFVGFIQAFIFAMLTLVFVAMAVAEEGAHEKGRMQ